MPEKVTLSDLLRRALNARQDQIHTAIPASVVRFNPATATSCATVDVQPLVNPPAPQADGDELEYEPLPAIPMVPILYPRGGGFQITFPLTAGDSVLLVFSERDTGGWRATGQQSDAADTRAHSCSFPFAVPGCFPDIRPPSTISSTDMIIGQDSSDAQIHFDGSSILLGKGASDSVALASKVATELTHIATAFSNCTPAVVYTPSPGGVGSSLIKAK